MQGRPLTEDELAALERAVTSPDGRYIGVQGWQDKMILRLIAELRRYREAEERRLFAESEALARE